MKPFVTFMWTGDFTMTSCGGKRIRKEVIHKVARPDHPGKHIYTAILKSAVSINEVATVLGENPGQLMKVLRGDARLGPRMAFLLSELFSWKMARRWMMMQAELNMFEAGVDERKARKILYGTDPGADYDRWERAVKEKWSGDCDDVQIDDHLEEMHNPVVNPAENPGTTMQEEIENGTSGT